MTTTNTECEGVRREHMLPIESHNIADEEAAFRIQIAGTEAVVYRWFTDDCTAVVEVQEGTNIRDAFPEDTGKVVDGVLYAEKERYDDLEEEWVSWYEYVGEITACTQLCWYGREEYESSLKHSKRASSL